MPKVTQLGHVSSTSMSLSPSRRGRTAVPGLGAEAWSGGRRKERQRHRGGASVPVRGPSQKPGRPRQAGLDRGWRWRHLAARPCTCARAPPFPARSPAAFAAEKPAGFPPGDPGSERVLPGAPSGLTGLLPTEGTRPGEAGLCGEDRKLFGRAERDKTGAGVGGSEEGGVTFTQRGSPFEALLEHGLPCPQHRKLRHKMTSHNPGMFAMTIGPLQRAPETQGAPALHLECWRDREQPDPRGLCTSSCWGPGDRGGCRVAVGSSRKLMSHSGTKRDSSKKN